MRDHPRREVWDVRGGLCLTRTTGHGPTLSTYTERFATAGIYTANKPSISTKSRKAKFIYHLVDSEPESPRPDYINRSSLSLEQDPPPWGFFAPLSVRYIVVLPAPYWDPTTRTFRDGVFCQACASNAPLTRDPMRWLPETSFWDFPFRRYAGEAGFVAHVDECGPVRKDPASRKLVHAFPPANKGFEWPDEMQRARVMFFRHMQGVVEYAGQGPGLPVVEGRLVLEKTTREIFPFSPLMEALFGLRTHYSGRLL
ncbi:hypothetical protein PG994_007296 [Apiospora phragmitis]|uniref:Uncharacterized protein n=1 Tax=Apiospora phragmitis TaxID=2905665 RepID=A0ABR1V0I3_9PEZI